MMFLVDTNVVSELRNYPRANANVKAWEKSIIRSSMFLSVISLFELELGARQIERRDPVQGKALRAWIDGQILPAFNGRILPIDTAIVQRCATLHVPDPKQFRDSFIAATALVHDMTVVTRNVADFKPTGVMVLNPWDARHLHSN